MSMRQNTTKDWDEMKAAALDCERLGYDSIWFTDHLTDYRYECWTILSAISQVTSRTRLGTIVLCNNFRNPALLAKMGATLDVISKGRLDFGIGAGWHKDEHEAYGFGDFPSPRVRVAMLREGVEIIKKMWTESKASFKGKHYIVKEAICEPKPVQKPHPPIMIGGGGERLTLKVVAACADKWNYMGSLEQYKHKLSVLEKHCKQLGRDPQEIEKTFFSSLDVYLNEDELLRDMKEIYGMSYGGRNQVRDLPFEEWLENLQSRSIVGSPEMCIKRIREFKDLGVTNFIFRSVRPIPNLKKRRKNIKTLAEEVISQIKTD